MQAFSMRDFNFKSNSIVIFIYVYENLTHFPVQNHLELDFWNKIAGKTSGKIAGKTLGEIAGKIPGKIAGKIPGKIAGEIAGKILGKIAPFRALVTSLYLFLYRL